MWTIVLAACLFAGLGLSPGIASAGWIVEWDNAGFNRNGDRYPTESATMYLQGGEVRLSQTNSVSLLDYNEGRFALLYPERKFFWSGKVEDYVTEMTSNRAEMMSERVSKSTALSYGKPAIDEDALPKIVIKKTDVTEKIAGHETTRYEVRSAGELFQELWLAEDIDLSKDRDPEKFLDYQRRMSAGMLGNSAAPFNALYRSEDYAKLLKKGYVLKEVTHHGGGGFERVVTTIRPSEIAAPEFEVPDGYRRVRLRDMFPPSEGGSGASGR